jgi:hypothetical protein
MAARPDRLGRRTCPPRPTTRRPLDPVTITLKCEADRCGQCRGRVLSMTGDRPCSHHCHRNEV